MGLREHFHYLRKMISSRSGIAACVILAALLAVMQVPHMHRNPNDADHCPLCVVMHTVAPAAPPVAAVVFVLLGISTLDVKPRALVRYWHPRLFTRPPPALSMA